MSGYRTPWDDSRAPVSPPPDPDSRPPNPKQPNPKRRGRRPASQTRASLAATNAAPDWLYHHLTIGGPADGVNSFAAAARGSGITPWRLDGAVVEEDVFVRAIAQPAARRHLTVAGCRILARQFRDRVEAHQARAAALVGHSQNCPFDLHTLLPVPDAVLQLGPADPLALSWMATHWGVTDRLRQVVIREGATTGRRLPRGHAAIGYGFFAHGETPHAAAAAFEMRWPMLRFLLQPRPSG